MTEENLNEAYGERAGLPVEAAAFVASLKDRLMKAAEKADNELPTNEYLRIEDGEATLKRLRRKPEPAGLKRFEKLLKQRMEPSGTLSGDHFHNVVTMTRAIQMLIAEDHQLDEEALACMSPYRIRKSAGGKIKKSVTF